jgi:hypothetical protein
MPIIVLLSAALLVSACSQPAQDPGYGVQIETQPTPMQSGKVATVLLRVQDTSGSPLHGARVTFTPEHSGMSMGGTPPTTAAEREPGVYSADFIPAMGGAYRVSVEVDGPRGKAQRAFDADVR